MRAIPVAQIALGGCLVLLGATLGLLAASLKQPARLTSSFGSTATKGVTGYVAEKGEIIPLTQGQLKVSSFNEPNGVKDNLIDSNLKNFWHVAHPKREPDTYIELDLGQKKGIGMIRVMPREGHMSQMWDGCSAFWEGRNESDQWKTISLLNVNRLTLRENEWINFVLPKSIAFRYYRLRVQHRDFLSMAELEIYGTVASDVVVFDNAMHRKSSGLKYPPS